MVFQFGQSSSILIFTTRFISLSFSLLTFFVHFAFCKNVRRLTWLSPSVSRFVAQSQVSFDEPFSFVWLYLSYALKNLMNFEAVNFTKMSLSTALCTLIGISISLHCVKVIYKAKDLMEKSSIEFW